MIVLDVETTGLYPEKNSLVSIGAVSWDDPEDRFYEECRIWDGAEVNPLSLLYTGFSEEEIRDPEKKTESDIVKNFLYWLSDKKDITVAGQNCSMDVAFVNAAIKRAGEKEALPKRVFEQHTIAMYHMMQRGIEPPIDNHRSALDSDTIMKYVGIPAEPKPHVAINGALWEFEALYRMIHGTPCLEEFQQYPVPWA